MWWAPLFCVRAWPNVLSFPARAGRSPLCWERARREDGAGMTAVTLGSGRGQQIELSVPVMNAAGCAGDGTEAARAPWLSDLGAFVPRTLTPLSRRGTF